MDSRRRLRGHVVGAGVLLVVAVVAAVVGDFAAGIDGATAVDSFQVPNLMLGVPAAACGLLIAWHRAGNRLGWFLIGAGAATVVSALSVPLLHASFERGWPFALQRTLGTTYTTWTACQFLFVPLAVLFFPDGRLPSPRWRPAVVFVCLTFVVEALRFASLGNNPLDSVPRWQDIHAPTWLASSAFENFGAAPALEFLDYFLIFAVIAVRYRRGDEQVRRQLLWLLWALTVAVGLIVVDLTAVSTGTLVPIFILGFVGLIPVAMTIAVLRYQVLDIRLVWSRTVAWLILTALVFGTYFALVTATEPVLAGVVPASAPAAVIVAAGFHPARMRLQRAVDSRLYGERADPVRAARSVAAQISTTVTTPAELLVPIRSALRLPYAELRDRAGLVASSGERVSLVETIQLEHAGAHLGELVVGVRVGQRRLSTADQSVLALIASPLALAIHTATLSAEVQRSAEEASRARTAERRRLRHDLHDGLGPLLTGIAFHADAADNLHVRDPERAHLLVTSIRETVAEAISEVRVLLDQLRPTSVEELGLVGAIEHHAVSMSQRADGSRLMIVIDADDLPQLSPVAETAIFRVVSEALNNVARHSAAERVDVEITRIDNRLTVCVQDDGGCGAEWTPGVGLRSMRERVVNLGGRFDAAPGKIGGRIVAEIPVEVTS
ncbi:histidine kinase [Smaragdicoccus niigatensis]|uniref:sensor histidine kinase n=1 Tax=Smaragdicoccus niigatensis TaxID=359359 RepID=UPI00037A84DB|nr:histidine kinase [Smaragdicoccus niigatensis]